MYDIAVGFNPNDSEIFFYKGFNYYIEFNAPKDTGKEIVT